MLSQKRFWLLFGGLFLFHLFFGLFEAKWWEQDEMQTYLIGLKYYTTHAWPYFGPDVNGSENSHFQSQIPGALEGLLIGLPFFILPIPEAPYVLLNLLTVGGAALLAWYIFQRIPNLSFYWLFVWICVTPWTLHKASHIINPAYDFLPSVLFFIGFMETLPAFRLKLLPASWANAAMGFSLFWIMQFHFSYVYLIPLAAFSLMLQISQRQWKAPLTFALGALPMLALILPTFFTFGFNRTNVASGFTVPFNRYNVSEWLTILARYFSLVSYELPRFIGTTLKERVAFLNSHPFLLLPGWILWIGGLLQPFILLFSFLKKRHPVPGWAPLKLLIFLIYLMIWVSFWFTIKLPLSHIYLVFFPWLMLFSCYVWSLFADNPRWALGAKAFILLALYFQIGFAFAVQAQDSLYGDRPRIVQALHQKDYRILLERRKGSLY